MLEATIQKLQKMRLTTMSIKLDEMKNDPSLVHSSWQEVISMLIDEEHLHRTSKRIANLLKKAKIKYPAASVETLCYESRRDLTKQLISSLTNMEFVDHGHNVFISGATGTGKSYFACTLANLSCRKGLSTLYTRIGPFFDELPPLYALQLPLQMICFPLN